MNNKPRRKWVAALLTILFSAGTGHMYSGRLKRGILIFAVGQLLFLGSAMSLTVATPGASHMFIILAVNLAYFIFCVVDAVGVAGRGKENYQPAKYNRWYAYIGFIVLSGLVEVFLLHGLVNGNYVQAYKIPTGNMEPTLMIGDRLLADKRIYKTGEPRRGDVAVFRYPEDPEVEYLKRLIGLPGEEIEIRERTVYINGEPLDEAYTQHINPGSLFDRYGPAYIPRQGDTIELGDFGAQVNGALLDEQIVRSYQDRMDSSGEPYVVPQDQYFALGDNRDNSRDSRYWGTVPRDHLLGKALIIYWSFETPRNEYLFFTPVDRLKRSVSLLLHFRSRTRWNRVFMPIE